MIKLVSGKAAIRMGMDQKERSGEAGLGGIHLRPEGEVVAKTPLRIVGMRVNSQRTSLVVQWLRICVAMQGMQV